MLPYCSPIQAMGDVFWSLTLITVFTGTTQDIGKPKDRKYERQDQSEH